MSRCRGVCATVSHDEGRSPQTLNDKPARLDRCLKAALSPTGPLSTEPAAFVSSSLMFSASVSCPAATIPLLPFLGIPALLDLAVAGCPLRHHSE